MSYYEAYVKYQTTTESGTPKEATEIVLTKAESYGDVEAKIHQQYEGFNFYIDKINKKNYNDIFEISDTKPDESSYFLTKVNYIVFEERTQKDKIIPYHFIVKLELETQIDDTFAHVKTHLGGLNDYTIAEIKKTRIINYLA